MSLKDIFYQHRFLIAYTCFCCIALLCLGFFKGAQPQELMIQTLGLKGIGLMLLIFFAIVFFYFYAAAIIGNMRQGAGLKGVEVRFNKNIGAFLTRDRLLLGFVGLIPLILINFIISFGKSMIPVLNPYNWDPVLVNLDHVLHFGHYPHEFIMPVIEKFHLSAFLNYIYLLWFFMLFASNSYALFCDNDQGRRMRYLWTFVLMWTVMGVILATLFASVGPLYFHHFYPTLNDPYTKLMAHLNAVHESGVNLNVIRALPVLLEMVENDKILNLNGISAMPSMHVAMAWLMVLYAFAVRRWAGFCALVYFILILAGSIYLSWHYAVDGYASVILVSVIWWMTGKFYNRDVKERGR